MLLKARSDLDLAGSTALKDAASYAEAYEHYVARSLSQIDQITMQLKYGWEQSAGATRLEDLRRNGMFTDPVFVSVAFYDASCLVPCDHIPRRSWPLFRAKAMLGDLIAGFSSPGIQSHQEQLAA